MRITLSDIVQHAKSSPKDVKWISDLKSRIKLIVKNEDLDEETIRYLWQEVTLRRPLVKSQKVPEDIISDIFELTLENKKRFVSSSVFKETLLNQDVDDDKIKQLWHDCINSKELESLTTLVKTLPIRIIEVVGIDVFIEEVISPGNWRIDYITSMCSSVIESDSVYLEPIVNKFLEKKADSRTDYSLNIFAKIAYFDDELVNKIYEEIDEMSFYHILQSLMSRNNCSYTIQAKFLLNK